jgi:catalase
MADKHLYEEIVDAANAIYGSHGGRRALHAKGLFCAGTFTATPEAAELSSAVHLRGEPIPALIRFSNGAGDPEGHDAQRDSRGMAVKLRPPGGEEWDLLGVTTPAFVSRNLDDFLELMRLRRPDPETGQPDMEKLGAFLGDHPESMTAVQATLNTEPPASYGTMTYHSPLSFKWVTADGGETWIRFRWRPGAGEATLPDDEARERGRDYLRSELDDRLREGPVRFELRLLVREDGDPLDDPTAVWPPERERITAGRLEITELVDDPESGDRIDVFDPTRVVDGIELSDDPILHARARAYSVSAYRRIGAEVDDPSLPPDRSTP